MEGADGPQSGTVRMVGEAATDAASEPLAARDPALGFSLRNVTSLAVHAADPAQQGVWGASEPREGFLTTQDYEGLIRGQSGSFFELQRCWNR